MILFSDIALLSKTVIVVLLFYHDPEICAICGVRPSRTTTNVLAHSVYSRLLFPIGPDSVVPRAPVPPEVITDHLQDGLAIVAIVRIILVFDVGE